MHVRSYACTHALPLCMYDRTHALPLYMYDRTHANNCLRTRLKPTTSLPRPRPREWKDSGSTSAQNWDSLAAKAWRRCDLEERRGQGCRNGRADPQRSVEADRPCLRPHRPLGVLLRVQGGSSAAPLTSSGPTEYRTLRSDAPGRTKGTQAAAVTLPLCHVAAVLLGSSATCYYSYYITLRCITLRYSTIFWSNVRDNRVRSYETTNRVGPLG